MRLFDLVSTQYNNFTTTIKTYLSKLLDAANSNFSNNTVFGLLIAVVNSVALNIMLYIEDAFVEQNKYTAVRKKSIYGLASLSGYQPSLGKASGVLVKLLFKPTNADNFNIVLNNRTKLTCTQNGLTYNLVFPLESIILSIDKDNSNKILYAVEGNYEKLYFVSSGGKYYTININPVSNIDVNYLTVKVNNEKWEYVVSTYDMKPDGKQFTLKTAYAGGVDIIFGNNKYGRALKDGDGVEVEYLLHNGEQGNIDTTQKTYFVFLNELHNVNGESLDGNAVFNIILANDEAITSGTDSETALHVKSMIGFNSRGLVLASTENYKQFINGFSFCGYNRTWSDDKQLSVNSLIIKNFKQRMSKGIDYFNLSDNDFKLTANQKSSIINSMKYTGNQLAGVTYNIIDPELCKYALYLYVKLKNNSVEKSLIESQIKNIIGEFFSNVENDMFIPKSDIIYELKSKIDVIDGVSAYFLSEKNETAIQTKMYNKITYKYNPLINTYDKEIESVRLYDGENPNIGLDSHGNILLLSDEQFPILAGGWDFKNNEGQEIIIPTTEPLIITFE